MGAEQDGPDIGAAATQLVDRLEDVGAGHLDIHEDDVGRGLTHMRDEVVGVLGAAGKLHVRLGLEKGPEPRHEEGVVIDTEDANR